MGNKVAGRLQFSKLEGLRLNLIGTLNPIFGFNETSKYPLVHGLTRTGKSFTLQNVFETGLNIGLPGFSSQALDADLFWLSQTLSFLVQVCMIRELGFSAERCVDIFANNQEYQYAVRRTQQNRKH